MAFLRNPDSIYYYVLFISFLRISGLCTITCAVAHAPLRVLWIMHLCVCWICQTNEVFNTCKHLKKLCFLYREPHSKSRKSGKILFISGKTGLVLTSQPVPDGGETYFSPVVYTSRNGTEMVVIGTGGETHKGSLYIIQLKHLYARKTEMFVKILSNAEKGKLFVIIEC